MLRHKGLIAGFLSVLAVFLVSFAQADDDYDSHARIVRLSYIEGQVQVAHRQGFGYENATLNLPVVEGDQIRTTDNGWVEIQLEDGSTVRVAPESQITFSALGRYSEGGTITEVDLDDGEAEFRVSAHDDSTFRVNVRQRVIALRHSGRFRVTSTSSDPLELVVWKGEVAVLNADDAEEVAVRKNETFVLDPMDFGRYDLEQTARADDLDQWVLQREDYLSSYAANAGRYAQSPYQYGVSDLNQYGSYVDVPGYGYCWHPYGVNLGWDPYVNGYWTYSPGFGYLWVSAYPWGWMPYRYGHWVFISGYGWMWQPGVWNRWAFRPRLVNPPSGFRPPAPPPLRAGAPVQYDGGPARLTVKNPLSTTPDRHGRPVVSNEGQTPVQHLPPPQMKAVVPNDPPPTPVRTPDVTNHAVRPPGVATDVQQPEERQRRPSPWVDHANRNPGGSGQPHVDTPPPTRTVSMPPPSATHTVSTPAPPQVHASPPPPAPVSRPSPPPAAPAQSVAPRSSTPPPPSATHSDNSGGSRGPGRDKL